MSFSTSLKMSDSDSDSQEKPKPVRKWPKMALKEQKFAHHRVWLRLFRTFFTLKIVKKMYKMLENWLDGVYIKHNFAILHVILGY